jgi:orotidine-5'-phosphate decarboxylase
MGFREDLLSSSKKHSSRVILALDVTGPQQTRVERAAKLLEELGDEVAGVKVHWHLILPRGLEGMAEIIQLSASKNLPIIADIKLNDIESTNLEAVDLLFTNGVSAVIANPFVGAKEGLSQVIARSKKLGKGVILLVYMSHAGAKEGYGLIVNGKPLYLEFARRVRDWDADGAIVSAKSPSIIREVRAILKNEQLILSPGVGVQGGRADQSVIEAGTDFAIIGRSIIEAADPKSALKVFNSSMSAR